MSPANEQLLREAWTAMAVLAHRAQQLHDAAAIGIPLLTAFALLLITISVIPRSSK